SFGNRIHKTVRVHGAELTPSETSYMYDGWNPAKAGAGAARWDVVWEWGATNIDSSYLHGDGVDELYGRLDVHGYVWYPFPVSSGSAQVWLWTDRMGSVVAATDASGTVQAAQLYDAFGNVIVSAGGSSAAAWLGRFQ